MKRITLIATTLLAANTLFAQTWSVDKAHSRLGFGVTHLAIAEIDGNFNHFSATITTSSPDFSGATVELTAEIASIDTDNEQRNTHLKSPDFFDAAKYPTLTFKSRSFEKTGDKQYKVTGDLTMHGVTKPVTLEAVLNGTTTNPMSQKETAGFRITGVIKRSDFGIAPSMPDAMISDEVQLVANTEFSKD